MATPAEIRAKQKEVRRLLRESERLSGRDSFAEHRDSMAEKRREISAKARDIGEMPPVADPARRLAAEQNFRLFCETYLAETFNMAWSPDHLKMLTVVEKVVLQGEQFAMAMPRGSGKTSICEAACLWALAYGHRRFVVLIGSEAKSAEEMLTSVRAEFEDEASTFAADFPEISYPISKLEGITQRRLLYHGKVIKMGMTADQLLLPAIEGSKAAGGILRVAGITGRIRGMKHKRKDKQAARPDLVILDDPQTDESARSGIQCDYREKIVTRTVLGLAGPGKKIAAIMPCTRITITDLASRLLDRNKHPQWQGEATKLVYSWPTNEKLWEMYRQLRAEGMRLGEGVWRANAFYATNRGPMDAGSVVAWNERHKPDELSAIQHAMNLRYDWGDAGFFAEFQNEPFDEFAASSDDLKTEELLQRMTGLGRGVVPMNCQRLTAFVDVSQKLTYWMVVGWTDRFGGSIVDYGTYPRQHDSYFTAAEARQTLQDANPGAGLESCIHAGLKATMELLLEREWQREDSLVMRIERCLVDSGYQTDTVYAFCRQSHHAALLTPSKGLGIGAANVPFERWTKRPGETLGTHWALTSNTDKRAVRHVKIDVNWWKSFVAARLVTAVGDHGALTMFGKRGQDHAMLVDHLVSEKRIETSGQSRTLEEWRQKPNTQNHWWDCLVGAAAAASMQGTTMGEVTHAVKKKERVDFAALQAAARGR